MVKQIYHHKVTISLQHSAEPLPPKPPLQRQQEDGEVEEQSWIWARYEYDEAFIECCE